MHWSITSLALATRGRSEKMSKSKRTSSTQNTLLGLRADTARLFMLSDSPPDRDLDWTDSGVEGAWRYLNRLWRLVEGLDAGAAEALDLDALNLATLDVLRLAHKTIGSVSADLDRFHFNKAVARLRELTNGIDGLEHAPGAASVRREAVGIWCGCWRHVAAAEEMGRHGARTSGQHPMA